jgi:hypothetical protein
MFDQGAWSTACHRATAHASNALNVAIAAADPHPDSRSAQPPFAASIDATTGPPPTSVAIRRITTRKPTRLAQKQTVPTPADTTATQKAA